MDTLSTLLGVLAGVLQVYGYWVYNREVDKGNIDPNGSSWALWGVGTFIVFIITSDLTGDWVVEVLPLFCSLSAFVTFVLCAKKGKLSRPDNFDIFILILDLLIMGYWITSGDTVLANIALQVDAAITFVPMLRSVWKNPSSERPKPWLIWSLAYGLLALVVSLRVDNDWALLYPLNYFVLHITVWAITRFKTARS